MKKGKKQAKRRNANVTMAFGIREKIVLCFLVPVLFMIVLGIISYRKAADGMSSSYRDSTQQTIEMALQNIDTSNSFISAEALKYVVDSDLGKYFVGIYDNDPTSKRTLIDQVKTRMTELVKAQIPVKKRSVNTDEAIALFHHHGMYDKEKLFNYRRSSAVNLYSIGSFEDYFYGFMANHTGYIKTFDLFLYEGGFVLQLPTQNEPDRIPEFKPREKIFRVQKESQEWGDKLDIATVGDLNEKVTRGGIQDILLIQEAMQEAKISEIASEIAAAGNKKFVMIAGPSSSGKTTFSHRLSIQLAAHGMKPHPIAVDNYFIDRHLTPVDEFGEKNFECLEAIDVEQFNKDMLELLEGKRVEMPVFNFKTGTREYKGDFLQLDKDDILVIEGIHGLNDRLSYALPKESKFKIYLSALTQLNIDEHNRIPTTDGRLIRRIVRDARTRGTSAKETIARWPSVRRGEEQNIFPFQEDADVMFNSALIYELACLKVYAEPLLFGIAKDEPEYTEAKRLLKFFEYFVPEEDFQFPMKGLLPIDENGIIHVPQTPGIGGELDWDLIHDQCHSYKVIEL